MVEIINTSYNRKRLVVMAFRTVLSKFIGVGILVAIGAIGSFYTFKFLEFHPVFNGGFMTFGTSNMFVLSG